jgi:uncharacterized protein
MKKNMKETKKTIYVLAVFLSLSCLAAPWAFALDVPPLSGRVNDYADVLNPSQEATLEDLLKGSENKTSSQVVLLTIKALQGEVLEDYSLKVVEKWKIGQEEFDNGLLVLVTMKERKIRVEVGYGLEHIITDAKSSYIIRKLMVPYFKKGDYYGGINKGLMAVSGLISKEFEITPEQLAKFKKEGKSRKGTHLPFGLIVFVIIIVLSFIRGGTRRGYRSGGIFWGGGFGSGGGGFGSGGGFSGGGGSFGGGGSSGGW